MKNIIVTKSDKKFIKIVCDTIKEQANKNIKEKGRFTFVISGGRTPKSIFDELSLNYRKNIEWKNVHFFWLDERCVLPSHVDSNYKLGYEHLIVNLGKVGSVHRMKGELEPKKAVTEYIYSIESFFGTNDKKFDFVLLGMGEDGHVASLFNNSNEINKKSDLVLNTQKVYNGYKRITLGLNLINRCFYKLLLVTSKEKLEVLKDENLGYPIHNIHSKNIIYLEV